MHVFTFHDPRASIDLGSTRDRVLEPEDLEMGTAHVPGL